MQCEHQESPGLNDVPKCPARRLTEALAALVNVVNSSPGMLEDACLEAASPLPE